MARRGSVPVRAVAAGLLAVSLGALPGGGCSRKSSATGETSVTTDSRGPEGRSSLPQGAPETPASVIRYGLAPGPFAGVPGPLTLDLGNGVTMELVYIPPGRFMMGSPASESKSGRSMDETQHEVTITKGFYLGKYEVTQAQYQAVMGANPSNWKEANRPVEQVSWNDATEFCSRMTQRVGRQVRLPTEAEWEYACRAGTTAAFHFGDSLSADRANFDGNYPYGGAAKGVFRQETTRVGSFQPNAWGLCDMHGNVWEWCSDWYGTYPTGAVSDPQGAAGGTFRVVRGGSWYSLGYSCRSAYRFRFESVVRDLIIGFRALVVER